MTISRRLFMLSAAMAPFGCASMGYLRGTAVPAPSPLPAVRAPQVGQEWSYVQRDMFNGNTLGTLTERVQSVGSQIVITRSMDTSTATSNSSSGAFGAIMKDINQINEPIGSMANEVQGPWGTFLANPNWKTLVLFNPGVPAWPQQLNESWSKQTKTKYQVAGNAGYTFPWEEYMSASGWETITVPAGTFTALKFNSLVNYTSPDANKINCIWRETCWFAPQIGRWVARESSGSYMLIGVMQSPFLENEYAWQLSSWK